MHASTTLIPPPPPGYTGVAEYVIRPRERRSFHTVLDAADLIDPDSKRRSVVRIANGGDELTLSLEHPLARGRIHEQARLAIAADGLHARGFVRETHDDADRLLRREEVTDFDTDALRLPVGTYPEVVLPYLAGWIPLHRDRVSIIAWINDRFVARMYIEPRRTTAIDLPCGRRDALEIMMYPDLNDWVHLGSVLSRLAKPFIPKYRMWYEPTAPHRLLRFEGSYGPPGAPEIVLELASS